MSSCFDTRPVPAEDEEAFGPRISSLISAMADELACLTQDVVKLGECVSRNMAAMEQKGETYELQTFDIFAQMAYAQARLLKSLAQAGADRSGAGIAALIEEIPFADVRQRLRAAADIGQFEPPAIEEADDCDVSWF